MIVDTNALSALAEGNLNVRETLSSAAGPFLPAIVLGEYRYGLMTSRERARRERWLDELQGYWNVLAITEQTARGYARIRQELKARVTPIPSNDAWIAALAREHGLPILSNDAHFDFIEDIARVSF